ncbi:MAG: hypothetical protein K0S61_90 [Anaerocolumna sp.]|jgi:hypothetical protein|nr:hypothetical protein [Anaerocolumna sp.]
MKKHQIIQVTTSISEAELVKAPLILTESTIQDYLTIQLIKNLCTENRDFLKMEVETDFKNNLTVYTLNLVAIQHDDNDRMNWIINQICNDTGDLTIDDIKILLKNFFLKENENEKTPVDTSTIKNI